MDEISGMMKHVYDSYSACESLITFDRYLDFCKDFSLFPDIVNLVQVKSIFYTLSEVYKTLDKNDLYRSEIKSISSNNVEKRKKKNNQKTDGINFLLFLDSLAMISSSFKFHEQFQDHEKILYLVERMNQSKGLNKIQSKTGTTL